MSTKNLMFVVIGLIIIIGGGLYFFSNSQNAVNPAQTPATPTTSAPIATTTPVNTPPPVVDTKPVRGATSTIGTSVDGNPIVAYHFGTGTKELLFVGGIHGGYSYNTALVAFEMVDYLTKNPTLVPSGVTVTIIPVLNPDGLKTTTGSTGRFIASAAPKEDAKRVAGRFNSNTVDINRNFDCEWSAKGTWQSKEVGGGTAPFSEPESAAVKNYVAAHPITAVVAWYSAAGGVYASNCKAGVLPATTELVNLYAKASGYKAYNEFNYYEITGDMVNWFAKLEVPAISVLLTTHDSTEWTKNQAGIDAMLKAYTN